VIFVDTCVVLDVVTRTPEWVAWSEDRLATWSLRGPLLINAIVFAEFCAAYNALTDVQRAVDAMQLNSRPIPDEALFLASQAHRLYRRRGGNKSSVLPDFLIGAHASVLRVPILTRDPRRFTSYFSDLEVVSPD
jgi:predicted nucleic acid-binding protein